MRRGVAASRGGLAQFSSANRDRESARPAGRVGRHQRAERTALGDQDAPVALQMDRPGSSAHARANLSSLTPVLPGHSWRSTSSSGGGGSAQPPQSSSAPAEPVIRPRSAAALATVASVLHHQVTNPHSSVRAETAASAANLMSAAASRSSSAGYGHRTVTPSNSSAASSAASASQAGASTAATAAPAPVQPPNPNDALIKQIEAQWMEYARALTKEQEKGAPSVAALSVLLGRLQSNSLLNFFEFQSSRSILSIYGPSFDCLYYNPPIPSASSPGSYVPGSIYRDRQDYMHTLGSLTTLTFRFVDFQLVALQLPLIRARCPKLKHVTLCANNIHSLYQLDELAILAPTGPPSSNSAQSQLETMTLQQNSVTEGQLYRRYLVSVLTMNVLQLKDGPSTSGILFSSPRSSSSSSSSRTGVTSTGVSPVAALDGRPITDEEITAAWQMFGAWHREKYVLNPPLPANQANSNSVASRWLEQLSELSMQHHGGPAALGTAANALYIPPSSASSASAPLPSYASSLPLPLSRPLSSPGLSRRSAKRAVEEILGQASKDAERRRVFERAWKEAMQGRGGAVERAIAAVKKSLHDSAPLGVDLPPTTTSSQASLASSNSTAALHRDKTRAMKLLNTSATVVPTAGSGAQKKKR